MRTFRSAACRVTLSCMATTSVIRRRYWKLIAGLLAVYGSIVGIATAFAVESEAAPPQELVSVRDLNLRDPQGVATAYNRLLWAAQRVCAGADSADYWVRESATPCIIQAVSRAINSIGAPQLIAYAQSQPLFRLRRSEREERPRVVGSAIDPER